MPPEPSIMPELRDLLPAASKEERAALKAKIKEEGQQEDLVAWLKPDNTAVVVEGHTRLAIMKELGIKPKFRFMEFENLDEAKEWMYQNALGRRNLPPQWVQYLIGKEYLDAKKKPGESRNGAGERTSVAVAKKHQVSEKTVRRAAKLAKAIDQKAGGNSAKRAEMLAKKKTKAKKTRFDHKAVEAAFGKLNRGVDFFFKMHNAQHSNHHRSLNQVLANFWDTWVGLVKHYEEAHEVAK
jgi:hypothetical protein